MTGSASLDLLKSGRLPTHYGQCRNASNVALEGGFACEGIFCWSDTRCSPPHSCAQPYLCGQCPGLTRPSRSGPGDGSLPNEGHYRRRVRQLPCTLPNIRKLSIWHYRRRLSAISGESI